MQKQKTGKISIFSSLNAKLEFLAGRVELTQFPVGSSRVELKIWATRLESGWKCEQSDFESSRIQNVNSKLDPTISLIKTEFKSTFKMTNLNSTSHYLDMKIRCDKERRTLTLLQTIYLKTVLEKFDMQDCVSVIISIKASISNSILLSMKQADEDIIYWYEISIDSLMYVMMTTRSDIVFALSVTSQYCSNSNQTHVALITWIFKYIKNVTSVPRLNKTEALINSQWTLASSLRND
jgi:hypothetical protein